MIPWEPLGETVLPSGERMSLQRRGDEFALRVANVELMNSRQHGSEEALATLAARAHGAPRTVLVGGLGMGFTLRAALDALAGDARVTVAELVPQVVEWNRTVLAHLAGDPLADRRVQVAVTDVAELLKGEPGRYDLILLDTDNGPEGTTQDGNAWLYSTAGLAAARGALAPRGVLAVWSAFESAGFTKRLARAGFTVSEERVRARGSKGARHVVWLARRA